MYMTPVWSISPWDDWLPEQIEVVSGLLSAMILAHLQACSGNLAMTLPTEVSSVPIAQRGKVLICLL